MLIAIRKLRESCFIITQLNKGNSTVKRTKPTIPIKVKGSSRFASAGHLKKHNSMHSKDTLI